jgi:hypothetical protein
MENDKNKPFSLSLVPETTYYKVNIDAIKTIKDIKLILKRLDLSFSPRDKEEFERVKHLLIIN